MNGPYDVLSDAELVQHVRRGRREAFRVLVYRYQDILFRYAHGLLGEQDTAADMVQGAFVTAFAQIGKLNEPAKFGGWVHRICMNRCRDHLKSRRRRDIPLDDSPADALTATERADALVEQNELRSALDHALAKLNDEHREAFVLKHIEERSYEEMSTLLGVSVAALKMRVHRAREALKSALEEVL